MSKPTTALMTKPMPRPVSKPVVIHHDRDALGNAHAHAAAWAEHGYTEVSRSYWAGMRDTLAVLLAMTTTPPMTTGRGSDGAAIQMLPECLPISHP